MNASTVPILIAACVLQAVGAAGLMPASLELVMIAYPLGQRAAAVTFWGAIGAAAAAVGPSLVAIVVDIAG